MKILAVGDDFVPVEYFERALACLAGKHEIRFISLDETIPFVPSTPSEKKLREYAGSPSQLLKELVDEEVLLIHGAPVSDEVLQSGSSLKFVGVARGGPVNVDVEAAIERGVAVLTAPGRNADSVADLTICFATMLARGIVKALAFTKAGGTLGESAFEGRQFFGHELGRHVLGLVGFGQVGSRVAKRALAFGMTVLVYDPYIDPSRIEVQGIELVDNLDNLLARADFVSLHVRATAETESFFDKQKLSQMKRGAFFINTARETLINEQDLYEALDSSHLAGAALDVVRPYHDGPNPLVSLPNVIVAPHIGGATYEAALRGVEILVEELERYCSGQELRYVLNRQEVRVSQ